MQGGWTKSRGRAASLLLPGALVLALAAGCSGGSGDEAVVGAASSPPGAVSDAQARVIVTTGYGAETVVDTSIALTKDTTAMQALQSVSDVGTAYGGGFVQSINGIGETRISRTDWFYAINGVLANRGAANEVLRDGDVEHWDFREWRFRRNVSATLGCFPSFFVNGYGGHVRPTVVACEPTFEAEGPAIAARLEELGVEDVDCIELSSLSDEWKEERNLIIVAGSGESLVRDVYARWDKLGLFAYLEDDVLSVFTASGEEAVVSGGDVGLLQPMQNPWNPSGIGACETVVILVSGTDSDGVRSAAAALVERGDIMATWCGAIVRNGVVAAIPLQPA